MYLSTLSDEQLGRLYISVCRRISAAYDGGGMFGFDLRTISKGWRVAYTIIDDECRRRGS